MGNNNQYANENKGSNGHSEQEGYHSHDNSYRMGDFKASSDGYASRKFKKQRQKTTLIALSILAALSFGLIGFEVITNKPQELPNTNMQIQGSKSLLILSKEREKEGAGLITSLSSDWNYKNLDDQTPLNEANRIHTNKINNLKRQLVEANQKLHEVKSHLFTKGDPADRSRLAEVCQDVVEKEKSIQDLKQKLAQLDTEKEQSLQKIKRMEQTIDALAAMTDAQRETKEQALISFQGQLEQLQNHSRSEQEELQKNIEEITLSQQELRETLADKLVKIENLENELTSQYGLLEDKEQEIQRQAQLYNASERNLNRQLQDLIASMELEVLKNYSLKGDLEVFQAKHSAQQQYSTSLEDQMQRKEEKANQDLENLRDKHLSLAHEYLDLHGLIAVYSTSNNNLESKQKKLASLVREERKKTETLQANLETTLAQMETERQRGFCLEEELHKSAQKIIDLNNELTLNQAKMHTLNQELETMTFSHASQKDQLHEKIQQLTASLDDERNKASQNELSFRDLVINYELQKAQSQELNQNLIDTLNTAKTESEHAYDVEEQLHAKVESLAALEDLIQDKQSEILALTSQLSFLERNIEEEKMRTQELHYALVSAIEKNETDQVYIENLKSKLDENQETIAWIQNGMSEKKESIDQMESRLEGIQQELEQERQKNSELLNELASATSDSNRAKLLETDLANNQQKIIGLEDSLADKQHEVRELIDKFQQLSDELNIERTRAEDLENQLADTSSKHDTEKYKARSLEKDLSENEKQIDEMSSRLNEVSQYLDNEREKTTELEKNLFKLMSKVEEKDQVLDRILTDHHLTKEELDTLKQEVQRIKDERDALLSESMTLSKKSERQIQLLLQQQNIIRKMTGDINSQQEAMKQMESTQKLIQEEADSIKKRTNAPESKAVSTKTSSKEQGEIAKSDTTHLVVPGESLSTISVYYYGTPNRWIDIFNANPKILKNKTDPVAPGMKLQIPK